MPLLFFGTYDASDVGIPKLSVGADRSLGEPGQEPVIRVRGADDHGQLLFDHTAPALSPYQLTLLLRLIDKARGGSQFFEPDELADLEAVIGAAAHLAANEKRLTSMVDNLRINESLRLGDEGATTITCRRAPSSAPLSGDVVFTIARWGHDPVRSTESASEAVAIATADLSLPRAEHVVGS